MNIYSVKPRVPVYFGEYVVFANSYSDAEEKVLKRENQHGADCKGIAQISLRQAEVTDEDSFVIR